MRTSTVAVIFVLAGCAAAVNPAPIQYKSTQKSGPAVDGVELAVLCELAERIGTNYLAAGIGTDEAQALQQKRRYLNLLNIDGVSCGRADDVLDLPFVSDPERRLVSTWGGYNHEGTRDGWGSCLADTNRPAGDRVVFCEVSAAAMPLGDRDSLPELPTFSEDWPEQEFAVPEDPLESARLPEDEAAPAPPSSDIARLPEAQPQADYRPVPEADGAPLDLSIDN
ncbi:MAG: hypothetical protein AAGA24_03660 [Pseudomonadota bacterium]